MGNDVCPPEGPDVIGWILLKNGDKDFNSEENDNKPYYYHPKDNLIWRRNIMGWVHLYNKN